MHNIDNQTLQVALFALVALAMLVQAIVLLAAFLAMRKAAQSMNEKLEEVRSSVMPIIETTRELLARVSPRIADTSGDVAALAHSLRVQVVEIQSAANEIVARARAQAGRIDSMVSSVLDTADRACNFLADAVNKPIRQLSALLASLKAVVESLRSSSPAPQSQSVHSPGDGDMFV